jgi:hypothetical protein
VQRGATALYDPTVIPPADLVDATYGTLVGYLVPYDEYKMPESDPFFAKHHWPRSFDYAKSHETASTALHALCVPTR